MDDSHDYAATLRMPETGFPMRGLASPNGPEAHRREGACLEESGAGDGTEAMRSLRNAFRFMLGNLRWDDGTRPDRPEPLEAYMLALLEEAVKGGPAELVAFVRDELTRFYFDSRKDALYCDPVGSARRVSALSFMSKAVLDVSRALERWTPALAGEAREAMPGSSSKGWGVGTSASPQFLDAWKLARLLRSAALDALEQGRMSKRFSSGLDTAVELLAPREWATGLSLSGWKPDEVVPASSVSVAFWDRDVECRVAVSAEPRCARSWRRSPGVGSDPMHPRLSARDAMAVREMG